MVELPRRVRQGGALVIAHVGGVPVEELVPSLAGAATALLVARGWLALHLRRRWGHGA
jgi:hypothetical protein